MLAGLIFCVGAIECDSIKEKENEKLAQQSKNNKRFMRDISRTYLRGTKGDSK